MISHLSWLQFILFTAASLGLYYVVVLLLYFRNDFISLLKRQGDLIAPFKGSLLPSQEVLKERALSEETSLLADPETIRVAPSLSDDDEAGQSATLVDDILQEIQSLMEMAAETQAAKEEFLSLLQLVAEKYGPYTQVTDQEAIQHAILEQSPGYLPFELTTTDLQSLWPAGTSEQDPAYTDF